MLGGADGTSPGVRAVPSLKYRYDTPPFSEHYSEADGNDSVDQGPVGGLGWDGRAASGHEQAVIPLLSPFEMANTSEASVIARLRSSPTAASFREVFGSRALDDPSRAWNGVLLALEVFQQAPKEFYPYSSKYDAWLKGRAQLSASERHGFDLFNDPAKGNCASCHPSAVRRGALPQFTDYGLISLGVPRNAKIPANANPSYYDLGLCGPYRTDLAQRADYCGLFKTPSLRNAARRSVFFHNGVFNNLTDVVRFYVERDNDPEAIAHLVGAGSKHLDDLPQDYREQLNVDAPFRTETGQPALNEDEIADVVTFLETLNDGFEAPAP